MLHRLITGPDEAWDGVMELLAEADGQEMTFNDDGWVMLKWGLPTEDDRRIEEGDEVESVEEAAPFCYNRASTSEVGI